MGRANPASLLLIVGVPRELKAGEPRLAWPPSAADQFPHRGHPVPVERGKMRPTSGGNGRRAASSNVLFEIWLACGRAAATLRAPQVRDLLNPQSL